MGRNEGNENILSGPKLLNRINSGKGLENVRKKGVRNRVRGPDEAGPSQLR